MALKVILVAVLALQASLAFASPVQDVHFYSAQVEPDVPTGSVHGMVTILFSAGNADTSRFEFACGDLEIDSVLSNQVKIEFVQDKKKVNGRMRNLHRVDSLFEVSFYYHGNPKGGIKFYAQEEQVHTVYSTNNWMVCSEDLLDRATLTLKLMAPLDRTVIASGELTESVVLVNGKKLETWKQETEVPAYTFGFTIGKLNQFTAYHKDVALHCFSSAYSEEQLSLIFQETGQMMDFFAMRAGVAYPGKTYSQVIIEGEASQEMAGFCVLWKGYGNQVLGDSLQINLSAHELAHQWWGNNITCKTFQHFWLNEGLAVFMSSAFKEYRFGRAAYLEDIDFYCMKYQSVPDKPLVFPDWNLPTREDRTIVYFKGAYVFHLLRETLGDESFWSGIRLYSQTNFGKTVVTEDLQSAMEKASGKDLSSFFDQWVY